jgi:hypothetical protein
LINFLGKTDPHFMLDKCKRSCNLCGDLVGKRPRPSTTLDPKLPTRQAIFVTTSQRPSYYVTSRATHQQTSTAKTTRPQENNEDDDYSAERKQPVYNPNSALHSFLNLEDDARPRLPDEEEEEVDNGNSNNNEQVEYPYDPSDTLRSSSSEQRPKAGDLT